MRARLFGSIGLAVSMMIFAPAAGRAAETQKPPPESQGGETKSDETLSEKLDRQKGVLEPKPGIDAPIEKPPPAPDPDSMPVIRPPRKPGTEAK
ncbi:hypothetical protein [Methylocystis sp. S23]|jgi:hypothetical protein